MAPNFANKTIRSLLYVLQGVESNIDLASEKLYEYRETQHQFSQLEYKMPGTHFMSDEQYDEYLMEYANKIIKLAEMPPLYVPYDDQPQEFAFQKEESNSIFDRVDGTSLKMTDISTRYTHADRQIIVREGVTGTLREATEEERRAALDLYYPSKQRLQFCPIYADPDHIDSVEAMHQLFTHGWRGPIQILDAGVNHYELDDPKYFRLRCRVNEYLVETNRLDDLYASRHHGQFILHILENKLISPLVLIDHLEENREGDFKAFELRALFIILECLSGAEISPEEAYNRVFEYDDFECSIYEELYPKASPPARVLDAMQL